MALIKFMKSRHSNFGLLLQLRAIFMVMSLANTPRHRGIGKATEMR